MNNAKESDEDLIGYKKVNEENLKSIKIYATTIENTGKFIEKSLKLNLSHFLDEINLFNEMFMNLDKEQSREEMLKEKNRIYQHISNALDFFHEKIKKIAKEMKQLMEINDDNYYKCKSLYDIKFNPPKIKDLEEFANSEINSFINSYSLLIKKITYQCDYILKHQKKELEEKKNSIIFPKISDYDDYDSYLNFIKDIDKIMQDKFQIKMFEEKKFDNCELDFYIINQISKIFIFQKDFTDLSSLVDEDNFNFSHIPEINFIETKNDNNNNMRYIKTEYLYNSLAFTKQKNRIKKYLGINKENKLLEKIKEKGRRLTEIQLIYLLDCISNINKERDLKMEDAIIKTIKSQLEYNESLDIRNLLIDFLITTEKFSELSLLELISYFPKKKEIIELYDFKIIKDLLCKECGITNCIDNRGNLLLSGKNQKFVGDDNYGVIPKDWIAIGIKFDGKYTKEGWVRCYYSMGNFSSDKIKEKLNKIINKEFEKEELSNKNNIRLKIKNSEENSSLIILNNIEFRVLLMVKIKKEELKKGSQAIFDNENVKVISILLKKLNKN